MKKSGQIRLEIYQYITSILGKDISEDEHINLKKLLTEHRDIERANEVKIQQIKIDSLENKIKSIKNSNRPKPKKEKPDTIRVWRAK